ncbi:efflux transporter outer membrane subunit [Phenylobacterium sp.]|uniref:efflux transporter outer membrane subunit n=1 Tax=Phenylobacterium sp. TaxID=1871053 RepID=UPI001220DB8D|nr:efflux transporter outer membrane subunit [Phenylobacterium sp.]THD70979.1 MAG: efflux transporter outer membrane subunit [Phenylobacterium sp.]
MTGGVPKPWRAAVLALVLGGCAVGPDYHRPSAPTSAAFKEAAGWTPSHPVDALDKGAWWSMFGDPELNGLEQRVATSNQTVKQFEAAYRQAHDVVAEARASFFPTVSAIANAQRSRGAVTTTAPTTTRGGTGSTTTTVPTPTISTSYEAALEASWVPDLWGKVRRTVESDKALAQASAADLANAKLAAQASLAEDYFQLRVLDEEARLYGETVAGYQRLVKLTQDQVREGTQPQSAVLTAQTQLYGAQASLIAVGVMRAQMEHAIAILVGVTPADLTIAPQPFRRDVPTPPLTLPSTLLERRPDIAAAERRVASGNALIGVAEAAYFPDVTLSGDYGIAASSLGQLFKASSTLWSYGASAAETLLDFGLRRAQVRAAKAQHDQDVAVYRQTVLTAFQGVEDELAALRIYQQEQEVVLLAEQAAQQTVNLDLDEFREGTIDYTTVIAAQASLESASLTVLTTIESRLNASVLLVENLGGGWTTTDLPRG